MQPELELHRADQRLFVTPRRTDPVAALVSVPFPGLRPLGAELMQSPITPYRVVEAILAARNAERPAA